jgi:hypothetical protein
MKKNERSIDVGRDGYQKIRGQLRKLIKEFLPFALS